MPKASCDCRGLFVLCNPTLVYTVYTHMSSYEEVKNLVEKGLPVSRALKYLGLNQATFYRNITIEQRMELQLIKTSFTKFGAGHSGNPGRRKKR